MTQPSASYQPPSLARLTTAHWRRCYPAVDVCLALLAFAAGFFDLLGPADSKNLPPFLILLICFTVVPALQNKILRTRLVGYGVTSAAITLTALAKVILPSLCLLSGVIAAQACADQLGFTSAAPVSPWHAPTIAAAIPVQALVLLRATRGSSSVRIDSFGALVQTFWPVVILLSAGLTGAFSSGWVESFASLTAIAVSLFLIVSTFRDRHTLLHPQP